MESRGREEEQRARTRTSNGGGNERVVYAVFARFGCVCARSTACVIVFFCFDGRLEGADNTSTYYIPYHNV
jgi:hypothetical protein